LAFQRCYVSGTFNAAFFDGMIPQSESPILFYSFIGLVIGVGLFFSRSMDRDVDHYFWAGLSNGGGIVGFSVFLFTLFSALIIVLPSFFVLTSNVVSVAILSAAFIAPLLIRKQLLAFVGKILKISSHATTVVLNILGLIFLCSVQILVLIQITDFVIVQFFGNSQYSMLVLMIVAAGIYTMAGGINAVRYSNIVAGSFSLISIVFIFVNAAFFKIPLFFSLRTALQYGAETFRDSGIMEANLAIAVVGIILIMICILWMQIGEVHRIVFEPTRNTFLRKIFGVVAVVFAVMTGILFLATTNMEAIPDPAASTNDPINYFIAVSFLGGLMGIFAITFQMVGSIVAVRVYPYFKKTVDDEEQILVGRLSTVFVVLLSIILISFAKVSGDKIYVWYINFIAFFFTPIVAALFSSSLAKKGATIGFMVGIIAGELYAVVELIGQQFKIHSSIFQSASAYAFAVEIAIVTLFASFVSAKASEMVVVQRMLSRMKISRTTTI
jgi:SSS family solute:Na+ symporter